MDASMPHKMSCKCSMCKSDEEHYRAESDARILQEAGEVRGDKTRYGQAMKHFQKKHEDTMKAVAIEEKVRKGLKAAFPKNNSGE